MGIRKSRQTERLGVGGWGAIRPSHNDPHCAAPSSVGFPIPSSRSAPRPSEGASASASVVAAKADRGEAEQQL